MMSHRPDRAFPAPRAGAGINLTEFRLLCKFAQQSDEGARRGAGGRNDNGQQFLVCDSICNDAPCLGCFEWVLMARWMIGEISVDRVAEIEGPLFAPADVFPSFDQTILQQHWGDLVPDHYAADLGRVIGTVQTYVLRTPDHTILVDTGCGNHKQRPNDPPFHNLNTPFLETLGRLGVAPEAVDIVFCTHLHVDHVGWNTTLKDGAWVPTFPNATYVFTQAELDSLERPGTQTQSLPAHYHDSIAPIIASGQARPWSGEGELAPGLTIVSTPGHSPGHAMLRAHSGGQTALFVGDVVQHPLQVYRPDWNSNYCAMPDAAVATRHRVLAECAQIGCLMFATHFAGPYGVRIRHDHESFALA